jgi:predicted metal-dependent peptidase
MFTFNTSLTLAQRLERNVQIIMAHESVMAMSPVILLGTKCIGSVPTACTDGLNEIYGAEFVAGLTDPEFRFLILHESGHKMYRHLTAWAELHNENSTKANIACDIVLNDWLQTIATRYPNFIAMPSCGVTGAAFNIDSTNKDVHQIYALLPDSAQQLSMDVHDWEAAKSMTSQEMREVEQQISIALQQGALLASRTGASSIREIGVLMAPRVDWRTQLQDFMTSFAKGRGVSTWRKPNRRALAHGMYLPGQIAEKMGELVVAIDTSGSINDITLQGFLSEIASIMTLLQPESVRLLYWDTAVRRDELYDETTYDAMPQSTKPAGKGGTHVVCVPTYMQNYGIKAELAVLFTDGCIDGSWGEWPCPTLWCITTKGIRSPIGSSLHIEL